MGPTAQERPIHPRHILHMVAGTILALSLANCGSDSDTAEASATTLAESDESTATTQDTSTSTAPPETDSPTDDSGSNDAATDSPDGDICASWETLVGHLGELDGLPEDTDFEAVWDSIEETASELTKNSPEGYEDDLSRMEQAWGEFRIVAREHNFDMDAAEADFDLIKENLGLEDLEILEYLETECVR